MTIPRHNVAKVPMRVSRPATLQTEFLSAGAALKGLCASFAGMSAFAEYMPGIIGQIDDHSILFVCRNRALSIEEGPFSRRAPWNFGCGS